MTDRPDRLDVTNELGQHRTLPSGPEQYHPIARGRDLLLLGLGADPAEAAALAGSAAAGGRTVYYVECPDFKSQMPPSWAEAIPEDFTELDPAALDPALLARAEIVLWWPGMHLFPSFWGPLAANCRWARIAAAGAPRIEDSVIVPASRDDLLAPEVCAGFAEAGLDVRPVSPGQLGESLPFLLRDHRPRLLFSINGKGLDPHGEVFHLLAAAGVPVVIWCVDNPFNLLSAMRSPYWREALLCVTDASFAGPLREHGARRVLHLPLAAWPEMFDDPAPCDECGLEGRLAFVGRSAFPGKDKFFAGCQVPDEAAEAAADMLRRGERPDFHWWQRELGVETLWPGKDMRRAGCGAARSTLAWRAACLRACADLPLTVYGDQGWRAHLQAPGDPEPDLREPVDYYGPLAGIYARAGAVLNVTGLLMSAALTQRHFDVWAAGGFLLTDDTPGLDLFPRELVEPVRFSRPEDIAPLARRWLDDEPGRAQLAAAWREHILAEHTYAHRARAVLDAL